MENHTEIVEEPRPRKRRNLTPQQRRTAKIYAGINNQAHQDEGFDEIDISIIVEQCKRNIDQHSGFAFKDVVTYRPSWENF